MKTTSDLFAAFLKCPTMCYLRSLGETGAGNEYADWVRVQADSYRAAGVDRLRAETPQDECMASPSPDELKRANWRIAVDVLAGTAALESHIHALERVSAVAQGKASQLVPIRFFPNNKLGSEDKLRLGFDALALSEMLGRKIDLGRIVHGADKVPAKVKTHALVGEVGKLTGKAVALLSSTSPPDLVLNRHCGECEFQARCRQRAIEKDGLTLLANLKEKERKKFNSEGIFTVTQLSYTFRPSRRPKRLRDKREKYHHALKALAIREKKIHIVGAPELKIDGTPVYLDVEALPDHDFYYLIGLRVKTADAAVQHSLWADGLADEKKAWSDFLVVLGAIEKPVLIHYGSFETTFLRRMSERYGEPSGDSRVAKVLATAINLVSVIFAQIYFPTYSNGLKDVGAWLGCKWSGVNASGAQSIIWRMRWQNSGEPALKQSLITYNAEDCQALQAVTETLVRLCRPDHRAALESGTDPAAVLAEQSASKATLWPSFSSTVEGFEALNEAARWDFQREKVYIRTDRLLKRISRARGTAEKRATRVNKEMLYQRAALCPGCGKRPHYRYLGRKTVYDIRFSQFGIRRWVVAYGFSVYWCPRCHKSLGTPDEFKPWGLFGRRLVMLMMYKVIDLCAPQHSIAQEFNRLFGLGLQEGEVHRLKARAAEHYKDTRALILAKMINGHLIHADETPIVLKHKRGYVWVFASFHEVVYFYTETREGDFLEQALKEFKGVLVSDFYAPYDSLACPQQKCLLHLIRDLNDEVLGHPYDTELKELVTTFAVLLRAIVQTIDRRGLKRRFLRKHVVDVDRFYRKISETPTQSEAALKLTERFEKNRNGLFTFLTHDGIPWNNNNAEHAVKAFARLRRAIVGLSTAKGIDEYLVLLSICQTCKYSGLDFLDFLLSGEKDVGAYAQKRGKRSAIADPF